MAGRFQAPITPSLPELNAQALAGDDDALRLLAERSAGCAHAGEFVERYIPGGEMLAAFDRYCDAFQRSRTKALLDTLELPKVQTNLNEGWAG